MDEMHSPAVAEQLRDRGYDVLAVKERPELIGLSDAHLLAAATRDRRALVTENVKDFAVRHKRVTTGGDQHGGLVFTHPRRFPRASRNHVRVLGDALAQFVDQQASALREIASFVWWLEGPRK